MAKEKTKSLVIVESPAKAKTISKFLGGNFRVEASIGHIRDLPMGRKEVPEEFKSRPWAYLGVNVEEEFTPIYIIPADKKKQVSKLKDALKEADSLYLATDEDREGEAISWHLKEVLKPKVPVHRLVFHEITKEAIDNALSAPRGIDQGLVKAQETRRILDRLFGYDVSQFLWKKVRTGLSAGRVQSVAVRLIVDRERERMAFHSATYFDLEATFQTQGGGKFKAPLVRYNGKDLPSGKDFDPATGKLKKPELLLLDQSAAESLVEQLKSGRFSISKIEIRPFTEKPKPPFTTSTLQQEANRKLGFTARRTMTIAQSLYENGYITYMRTDSTNLAQVAVDAARDLVRSQYGAEFLHPSPRVYSTKVKNAQEAHEAIRPAGHPFQLPEALRRELNHDQFLLFDMIWKRTIACQMADARKKRVVVTVEGEGATFQASGTTIEFEGFLRAYVEGSDDPDAALAEQETILPAMSEKESLTLNQLKSLSHSTQPPARFTEASLTRTLEELGIGRPSTYASIIDTIQEREYVYKKGSALVPSWTAFAVIRLLEDHLGSLVNYRFTARMEDFLDEISQTVGTKDIEYLRDFYFGSQASSEAKHDSQATADNDANDHLSGLKPLLESKLQEVDARSACSYSLGKPEGPAAEFGEIVVRVGKFGPFLEQGERRASIPDQMAPDELSIEKAVELLDNQAQADQPLGRDPESDRPIYVKQGRFGPYVQLGENDDENKRFASLLKDMSPESITLETALKLLSLPRTLGTHPETGGEVIASNGRFGPYVKCGSESRSLKAGMNLLEISLAEALELLKEPRQARGRGASAPRSALKTFDNSPVTEKPVQLFDGRYGPYVTDGTTNASLPKNMNVEELTFEFALQLLADRAAAGGSKKKARRSTRASSSTAKKKSTAEKKSTSKKKKTTARKKSSRSEK